MAICCTTFVILFKNLDFLCCWPISSLNFAPDPCSCPQCLFVSSRGKDFLVRLTSKKSAFNRSRAPTSVWLSSGYDMEHSGISKSVRKSVVCNYRLSTVLQWREVLLSKHDFRCHFLSAFKDSGWSWSGEWVPGSFCGHEKPWQTESAWSGDSRVHSHEGSTCSFFTVVQVGF